MGAVMASTMDPAGPAARDIADLWWLLFALGTAVFVLVVVLLAMALRRRADGGADTTGSEERNLRAAKPWLVGGGVVLPSVLVVVVLVATIFAMRATADEGPEGALTIDVTGHQWWWEVEYPDAGAETANEVHIPAGEPVEIALTSADVIHSFWIPELAGKMDALPDGVNTLLIEADEPGRYEGACAEFCGLQHASMNLVVVAHEPAAFEEWLAGLAEPAATPASAAARRGLEVLRAQDCGSCHTIAGTSADGEGGPVLTHLMSRVAMLGRGQPPTPEGLREWLTRPHTVKEGTSMPLADLTAEEVDALVAYLETLR